MNYQNYLTRLGILLSHDRLPHTIMLVCEDEALLALCAKQYCVELLGRQMSDEAKQSLAKRYENGSLVDVCHVLKDTATTISIQAVRSMIQSAYHGGIDFSQKIFVIHDCESMLDVAQNAFLKTLEEPPQGVFFLLLAKNTASILETIKSRCLILSVNQPSLQREPFVIQKEIALSFLQVLEGDEQSVFALSESLCKRDDLHDVLELLLEWMCDLCVYSASRDDKTMHFLYDKDVLLRMRMLARKICRADLNQMLIYINRAMTALEANVAKQLLLEAMLLHIQEELCKK